MPSYLPDAEAELNAWLTNFINTLGNLGPGVGVAPADLAALDAAFGAWTSALASVAESQAALDGLLAGKADARAAVTNHVRVMVRQIQARPAVTDAQRAQLGLTVRDTTLSPNLAAPASRPVATVDTSERLRHTIDFRDSATPTSRAKPKGAKGCEIWVKIAPPNSPPADLAGGGDPKDLNFLAIDSATPYLAEYSSADAGKTAHYLLRWVSTRDEKGPWSETVEATIVG